MRRILANTPSTISTTFSADDDPLDADGAVQVQVLDPNDVVVQTGTATHGATGVYSFTLAPQPKVNRLTVAWAGTFGGASASILDDIEIVGGRLATMPEIRALSGIDATVHSDAMVAEAITYAEDLIEGYCGTRFVPVFGSYDFAGTGSGHIRLPEPFVTEILSATVDGATIQPSAFQADEVGWVVYLDDYFPLPDVSGKRNCSLTYVHGLTPTPTEIRWAARTIARQWLLDLVGRIPDRALSIQSEFGQIQMAQAGGVGRPTSIPDVNAVLNRHRHKWVIAR